MAMCLLWIFIVWFLVLQYSSSSFLNTSCVDLFEGECLFSVDGSTSVMCSGSLSDLAASEELLSLTVCNYAENTFHVAGLLSKFPNLENFTLMASNVTKVAGMFPPNSSLKVLNFTNLAIQKIRSHVFGMLNSLKILDLRFNRLRYLHPNLINLINSLQKLYLRGNKWDCGINLDWVLYLNESVVQDLKNLTCHSQPYPDKPLKPIAALVANLRVECPDPCECTMPNVVGIPADRGGGLAPVILVNCSNRGLKKFPEFLPQNTTTVLLNNNKIRNVDALISNNFYRGVVDIYLDNNEISNIDDLEGSYWLTNFRVFSLKHNFLTQVPTYVLDNALQRNHNAVRIYFGNNPWKCDCLFTPSFQEFLIKYRNLMKETIDVKCSFASGDDNSNKPITTISRTSICRVEEYLINPLDLLNGILASLILLILGKLAYDYYTFKKTGQLPWIVTKMP